MGRWQALAIATALTVATIPAVGQGEVATPGPRMPAVPGDAGQLYDEVRVLRVIRTLELSAAQLAELSEINARVVAEREDLEALREDTWEQYEDEIETVLNAWVRGEDEPNRAKRAADRAVNRVNDAEAALQDARWNAAEALYAILSEEQRDRVESPGVAEERAARTARMGGLESVGEYVLAQLDALRDLMPDEFEMLAEAEAQRVATALVGPNAADLAQMRDAVLDVMLDVYEWTPERYQQQRQTLPTQIADALGFAAEDQRAPISWSDLTHVATSDGTAAAVDAIAPADDGEAEVE
ncbi:MAG: Spy/CpxP family protein refolding chaperone [Armatimonadota bacterium]